MAPSCCVCTGFQITLGHTGTSCRRSQRQGYRAISLTLRGYEPASIPADGDYTMETIATDILAVIDSLRYRPRASDWPRLGRGCGLRRSRCRTRAV